MFLSISKGRDLNPYYNATKTHHTRTGFTNPYLNSDQENKSFFDFEELRVTTRVFVGALPEAQTIR